MSDPKFGLFEELKRRNVFRVGAMYAVAGWLLIQIGETTFDALGLPGGSLRLLIIAVALGFPVALIVGWLFDWTAGGVIRTPDDPGQAVARLRGHRRIDFAIILVLVLALGMALFGPDMAIVPDEVAPIRAIAVLSFADMSPARDQEYFGDGIAEEIMVGLSRVDALSVTARTSAFAFKGRNEDIQTIGDQLGVGAVVEGSVRKSGDRLRITAQLIRVSDGFELWSDTFDRKLDDVFAIQEEIARATVEALTVRLVGTEPLIKTTTGDVRAYDAYLTGRHFLSRRTREGVREAVGYFERAFAIDPNFQLAFVGLADAHLMAFIYAYEEENVDSLAEAETAAQHALDLDANSGEARASLGYVHTLRWYWAEAETEFREAIRLAPQYPTARLYYAIFLRTVGQPEAAQAHLAAALELDPLSPILNREVGRNHFYRDEFDLATEGLRKALTLYPDIPLASLYLVRAKHALGQEPETFGWLSGQDASTLRSAYQNGGLRALMRRGLNMRIAETKRPCTDRPDLAAMTFALLKEPEPMYACLEKAVERRAGPTAIVVAPDPAFSEYRSEPRFVAILSRLNLGK